MYDAIKNFNKQFEFEPKIKNEKYLKKFKKFVVIGMGGSHLAADLLKSYDPYLDLIVYSDYGLPAIPDNALKKRLIILSSYSGNTEEVIDAFHEAVKKKFSMVAVSVGGKLIKLAKKHKIPYIQMPNTGIQPRSASGFSSKAILKITGEIKALKEISELTDSLDPSSYEIEGKDLAKRLKGRVPIIYSSERNRSIAYNWKIKFNETGKIPAFYNIFPEMNHNEINAFDSVDSNRDLSKNFYFIILRDADDDPRIHKRMEVVEKLYSDRGLFVETIEINRKNLFYKIFSALLIADWAAYYTADEYGVDPEQIPMVEGLKKLIKS